MMTIGFWEGLIDASTTSVKPGLILNSVPFTLVLQSAKNYGGKQVWCYGELSNTSRVSAVTVLVIVTVGETVFRHLEYL